MRKFITILTTAALLCNLPVPELTVQAETLSGKCGYNVTYTVADGVLTLTGTGATYDFERYFDEQAYDQALDAYYSKYESGSEMPDETGEPPQDQDTEPSEAEHDPQDTEPDDPDDPEDPDLPPDGAPDYDDFYRSTAPWGNACSEITTVRIGEGITQIGTYAFAAFQLETVELPETLKVIGDYAFEGANLPAELRIPDSVTEIGTFAFQGCETLIEVQFPASLQNIGNGAFSECITLQKAELPDSVTEAGESVFACCWALQKIHIPAKLQKIPNSMFSNTAITELQIPENITEIGNNAFNSTNIETLTVPEQIQALGKRSFSNCRNLTEVTLPDHLTVLPENCFESCSALKEIRIPSACTAISDGCFLNCTALESVTFPEGLRSVGQLAFASCSALTALTLPDSLETLGDGAFGASGLKKVNFPPLLTVLPAECFSGAQFETLTVPESIREVGDSCFQNCPSLKSIVFPDTDIRLEAGCLGACESLTEVHLPAHCKEIPFSMFAHCSALKTIEIPESCRIIGSCSFMACTELQKVTIPEGVTEIADNTFTQCSSLQKITIPKGVRSIGKQAFRACNHLTEVTFSEGLETVGTRAFENTALREVILPDSIKELGTQSFYTCGAEVFKLPAHEVKIGSNALPKAWLEKQDGFVLICGSQLYQYRGSETEIVIPEGVSEIMPNAFTDENGCAAVSIKVGSTVKSIAQGAIACSTLESLEIPDSVETININAVRSCPNLKVIRGEMYSEAHALAMQLKVKFEPLHPEEIGETVFPQNDTENFSFGNTGEVFGSAYHVTPWNLAVLCDASASPKGIQATAAGGWKGSCFGLSAVTVLVKNGLLPLSALDPDAKTLHDVRPSQQALDVINYYHLAQNILIDSRNDVRAVQLQMMLKAAHAAVSVNHGASPFILSLATPAGGHAVVGYGMESGEWTWDDAVYDRRILLWDSNFSGLDEKAALYFNTETLRWTLPAYSMTFTQDFMSDNGFIADVIQDVDRISSLPYDSVKPLPGDADRNDKVNAADAVLLAKYTAEDASLSHTGAYNADLNGDGILDLTDVRAVLRKITAA